MKDERVKVVTHITPEANQKVEAFMVVSGLTKGKVCALAIQAGIDALSLAFNADWKQYFEAKLRSEIEKAK